MHKCATVWINFKAKLHDHHAIRGDSNPTFLCPVINNAETLAVRAAKLKAILAPFNVVF
jgi:hypothetical protein